MTNTYDPATWLSENLGAFAALFDASGLMCGVMEEARDDIRYVVVNWAVADHFGLTPEQMIGKTSRALGLSEEEVRGRLKTLDLCHRKGPQHTELRRAAKGERRYYASTLSAAPPGPGGARRMAFVSVDVTVRKSAQTEAARQQSLVEAALDAAAMGVWEYDILADRLTWDARSAALIGVGGEPMSLADFMAKVHPGDVAAVAAAQDAAEAGENGGYYRVEHRMANAKGASHWIESTGRIMCNAAGLPIRAIGTVRDIAEEVEARERQAFVTAELNHRVKNNLAAVQAIANQTLQWSPDPAEFRDAFEARVSALGRAHDLLNANAWTATELGELMARSLEAAAGTVQIEGPGTPVMVLPERAMTLAIIFNELATNAAKHGCHSAPGGVVKLSWAILGEHVEIRWAERGGPPVRPPERQGFGTRILRAGVGGRDGAARMDFDRDGLQVRLTLHRSPAVTFQPVPEHA